MEEISVPGWMALLTHPDCQWRIMAGELAGSSGRKCSETSAESFQAGAASELLEQHV